MDITAPSTESAITVTMQWTFHYTPTYTKVLAMVINGVSAGATVQVQCHGLGCPFATHSVQIGKSTSCGGKPKRSQHQPRVQIACLAAGRTKPDGGC